MWDGFKWVSLVIISAFLSVLGTSLALAKHPALHMEKYKPTFVGIMKTCNAGKLQSYYVELFEQANAHYNDGKDMALEAYKIGMYHLHGIGTTKDSKKGVEWLIAAFKAGSPHAPEMLGLIYAEGVHVEQSDAESDKWYQKAVEVQKKLAKDSDYEHMPLPLRKLVRNYRYAYDTCMAQSDAKPEALIGLGQLYAYGYLGKFKRYENAIQWYRKAAKKGVLHAQVMVGNFYLKGYGVKQSLKKAVGWYVKAAKKNYPPAQERIAFLFATGSGFEQSHEKALKWYTKAANNGDPASQNKLGELFHEGVMGVKQDFREAMKWYKKAALNGNHQAMFNLGALFFESPDRYQDYYRAQKWFEFASKHGNVRAVYSLAMMYYDGLGVEKDHAQAIRLLKKAAILGSDDAKDMLGISYYKGYGVDKNLVLAYAWFKTAGLADKTQLVGQELEKDQRHTGRVLARIYINTYNNYDIPDFDSEEWGKGKSLKNYRVKKEDSEE